MLLKSRAARAERRTDNKSSTGARRTRFLRFLGLCPTDSADLSLCTAPLLTVSNNQALFGVHELETLQATWCKVLVEAPMRANVVCEL